MVVDKKMRLKGLSRQQLTRQIILLVNFLGLLGGVFSLLKGIVF